MNALENSKQYSAVFIGFILIGLVFIFTLYGPRNKTTDSDPVNNITTKEEAAHYTEISSDEFKTRAKKDKNWIVIDVRLARDFQTEHLIDALNLPHNEFSENKINGTPNNNLLVVNYGLLDEEKVNNAILSQLKSAGFTNIFFLSGGFETWQKDGQALISAGNPQSFTDQAKVSYVTMQDLGVILSQNEIVYLLDVRSNISFTSGHLKNAINIPLAELEKRRTEVNTQQDIIVYGDTEQDGFQAGVRLYDLNFFSVRVLEKGFANWSEQNLEIVK